MHWFTSSRSTSGNRNGNSINPIFHLLVLTLLVQSSWSFLSQPLHSKIGHHQRVAVLNESSSATAESETTSSLEIVLFGTGDLRTTDHGGLHKALSAAATSTSNILPLFILDTKDTLSNMPMGRTHSIDNASILHASLTSLQNRLKSDYGLDLHVCSGNEGRGVVDCLKDVIDKVSIEKLETVNVHSCDLGDVDNQLGYGPFGHLMKGKNDLNLGNGNGVEVNVQGWDCFLRQNPWNDLSSDNVSAFPSLFNEYEQKYGLNDIEVSKGSISDMYSSESNNVNQGITISSLANVPSMDEISDLLSKATTNINMENLESEVNTGLYATHWGGLDIASTMDENCILKAIDIFLGKDDSNTNMEGDEALAETLKWWSQNSKECKLKRNPKSLEHASMDWLMTGGVQGENGSNTVKTENLIDSELLTRYLAAPLLFGSVSPRYLWQQSEQVREKKQSPLDIFAPNLPSVRKTRLTTEAVKSIAENREWHKLFAAKNIRTCDYGKEKSNGTSYGYLRWHGFLCRYATNPINASVGKSVKEGIVLVHGFGASGTQWEKAMSELEKSMSVDREVEALAPDLIGFGQCEKPSLSYTQYLWEGYTADCVKEVGLGLRDWDSFTIGGNSIGGYTAMGAAADDTTTFMSAENVSALGSTGSGRCRGLVLMNSAGRILSKDEVNDSENTVAETTALNLLGTSSPPPRAIAKFGGNGLLAYLRPRIQSICKNLYPTNPAAVDDALCDGILRDSLDPGAINVMISGSKLPPPRTANELLGGDFGSSKDKGVSKVKEGMFDGPVLVAQGILDPLNDAKGRADLLGNLRSGITISRIDGGHCPHDELPGATANYISDWMETSVWKKAENAASTV